LTFFQPPEFAEFFDDRMLISWEITQPLQLPPLEKLIFRISGNPQIEFDPPQLPQIDIPTLNGNKIIINWVIRRPKVKTEILLSIHTSELSEEHMLLVNPQNES